MIYDSQLSECIARVRDFIDQQQALPEFSGVSQPAISLPNSSVSSQFNKLALNIFRLQYTHNPVVRRLCESRHIHPTALTDWRQIPAVPASAFKEFDVTLLPPNGRPTVFHSSGTTEQKPSRHFHNAESLALYEASLAPWFRLHLLNDAFGATAQPPSDCVTRTSDSSPEAVKLSLICLTPPATLAPHSSLVHMLDTVRRQFAWARGIFLGLVESDGTWALDLREIVPILALCERAQHPVALLGTAFGFVQLLDHLASKSLALWLPPGSRVMETGGYKGRSRAMPKLELQALITRHLGIPPDSIVCEYGMSELNSQAYDRSIHRSERVFHFPPWARAQIVSPETGHEVAEGETGLVRVCDLANAASSVSVQTEDLGVRRGAGFELLGRAAAAEPRGCSLMSQK